MSQRTLPTGCMSLVFHRGERLKVTNRDELQPHSFICGQESRYSDVTSTGDIEMIVVVFQPHAAKIFFRMPVTLLRDRNVAVRTLKIQPCVIWHTELNTVKITTPALN